MNRLVSNTRLVAFFCCLLFAAVAVHAQNGAITGTVKDNQGAVIPAAKVVLVDQERAGQRSMDSTNEGLFLFDSLPPSTYMVTVEAPGFKKWEKKDLVLYPGDRLGVSDIVMQVGQVSDTVEVEASAATLQTESAKVEGFVTSQQFTELSALTRNFVNMWRLIPGATSVSASDGYGGQANVNGQRNDQITTQVDGTMNMTMGAQGCCVSTPNMDMIEEMKVVTNGATADMGQVGSTQVMVVTKSGTKEFHGDLYYFQRREYLNANSWTNKINNVPRSRDRTNQGGFTLGGPLYIPKLFNTNKDKLFFFASTELWTSVSPNVTQVTVPTQAERNGDFSHSINMSDKSTPVLLDPNNLVNGVRQPLPNNQLPASLWNPDTRAMMNVMPLPNVTDLTGIQYNYRQVNDTSYSDFIQRSVKVDYNYSDKWRFYGRFGWDKPENGTPTGMGSFELGSAGQTLGYQVSSRTAKNGVLNATEILDTTTTNEIVLGYMKAGTHAILDKANYTRSSLGLVDALPNMSVIRGNWRADCFHQRRGPCERAFAGQHLAVPLQQPGLSDHRQLHESVHPPYVQGGRRVPEGPHGSGPLGRRSHQWLSQFRPGFLEPRRLQLCIRHDAGRQFQHVHAVQVGPRRALRFQSGRVVGHGHLEGEAEPDPGLGRALQLVPGRDVLRR